MWTEDMDGSIKKAGGDVNVVSMISADAANRFGAKFAELSKQSKPADQVVVILVGHGSYQTAWSISSTSRAMTLRRASSRHCWTGFRLRASSW
jgi:hypothetical protein